jgi:glycosyltransferase involved in cell wall biosynthesis
LKENEQGTEGWRFVIAGSDESGYLEEIRRKTRKFELHDKVVFVGPLFDQDKRDAFSAAELFLLPSRREAGPVTVLEALASGVPVLTTKGVPWGDLVIYHCGWWAQPTVAGVAESLRAALALSAEDLQKMGARGRDLVQSKYTWPVSAGMTVRLYQWILGRSERPEFVQVC